MKLQVKKSAQIGSPTAGTAVSGAPPDWAERLAEVNVPLVATGLMPAGGN